RRTRSICSFLKAVVNSRRPSAPLRNSPILLLLEEVQHNLSQVSTPIGGRRNFPAEHWKHLRTTNPIESAFATVRLRQRVTKGAGSRTRGLVFAYKLLDMASQRWRRLDGAQLLPLVRAGVKFNDGIMQKRQDQDVRKDAA